MKVYLIFLFASLTLITHSSCSRDKEKLAQKAIIGKWKVDKIVYNGEERQDVGTMKFTKKKFDLESTTYVVNKDELYEVIIKLDGSDDLVLGYEFYQGSTDMILTMFNEDGYPNNVFIELMTKKVLIYSDGGIPSAKYYLSK